MNQFKLGDYVEVAGKIVGRVEQISNDVILVRKVRKTFRVGSGMPTVSLRPEAIYIDAALLKSSYWIKSVDSSYESKPGKHKCNDPEYIVSELYRC